MRELCYISGTTITTHNTFTTQLKALRLRTRTLGLHPIFSYSLRELVLLGDSLVVERSTPEQLHLLYLALASHTRVLQFRTPANPGTLGLTHTKLLDAFPRLLQACARLALHRTKWNALLEAEALPLLAVDTGCTPIPEFLEKHIIPHLLALGTPASIGRSVLAGKEEFELEFERELLRVLHKKATSTIHSYTPAIGKHVLGALQSELQALHLWPCNSEQWKAWQYLLFRTSKEAVNVKVEHIESLWFHLNSTVKVSLSAEDRVIRAYVSLTLQHLEACQNAHSDLQLIFGGIVTTRRLISNPAIPVEFSVRSVVADPMTSGLLTVQPKAPDSKNPIAQRLLAMRKAQEAGGTTV